MASVKVNIRMDLELKKQFEAFCTEMGLPMSTAFIMFAKKVVRDRRIPFDLSGKSRSEKILEEAEKSRKRESIAGEKIS